MKEALIGLIIGLIWSIGFICGVAWKAHTAPHAPIQPTSATEQRITLDDLLDAIEQVESGGRTDVIGDFGHSVGCLQIQPIMVEDVNRILGKLKYTLGDRYDRCKSRNIAKIYLNHYCREMDIESKARCWNGGPKGYQKQSTRAYWEKVRKVLYE